MPPLFLPEIETLAEKDPMMYEILFRIQQSIINIPLSSGAATPTPTPALDPNTGLALTDDSGNPLFTIPTSTDPSGAALPTAQIAAQENALYMQTDPTGQASGLYAFGGSWQPIFKIVRQSDLARVGAPGKKFLIPGAVAMRGSQFDIHGRPNSSFFTNPVDASGIFFTPSHPLTQSGTSTTILIAATTWQFGEFEISFNSGSVDPGSYGTFNVYFDDPLFNGGAEIYKTSVPGTGATLSKRGRFPLGVITTVGGGGGVGSGGGAGGGRGGYQTY